MEVSIQRRHSDELVCPIRKMKSLLNKITDRTFHKISDEMLQITILENLTDSDGNELDKSKMEPIIQTFISNVCVPERNTETMNVYVKAFCKLKDKWSGRQGRVLMELMMAELGKFFVEYSKMTEYDNSIRNKSFKLCLFISMLYQENGVGIRLVLAILQTFCKEDKHAVEIFCKIFSNCRVKLMSEEIFKTKVLSNYKKFLEKIRDSEIDYMYKAMCLDILDKL